MITGMSFHDVVSAEITDCHAMVVDGRTVKVAVLMLKTAYGFAKIYLYADRQMDFQPAVFLNGETVQKCIPFFATDIHGIKKISVCVESYGVAFDIECKSGEYKICIFGDFGKSVANAVIYSDNQE